MHEERRADVDTRWELTVAWNRQVVGGHFSKGRSTKKISKEM
jgi:hypothetical protein